MRPTLALVALSLASCATTPTRPAPPTAAASRYRYDAASGTCVDGAGRAGLNAVDAAALFPSPGDEAAHTYPSGDAECVDFTAFDFNHHIGSTYATLKQWNFRGARFTKARFSFANMTDGDFRGADLSEFIFGYASVTGTGDAHTRWPKSTSCTAPAKDAIECLR